MEDLGFKILLNYISYNLHVSFEVKLFKHIPWTLLWLWICWCCRWQMSLSRDARRQNGEQIICTLIIRLDWFFLPCVCVIPFSYSWDHTYYRHGSCITVFNHICSNCYDKKTSLDLLLRDCIILSTSNSVLLLILRVCIF